MINNRGFTVIELLASLSISILFFYAVITTPPTLIKSYNLLDNDISYQYSVTSTISAIKEDLNSGSNEIISVSNYELHINNSIYNFDDDGLVRIINGSKNRLTDYKLSYYIDEDTLYIYNDDINLKFNIQYSSFEKGKVLDYE